MLGKLVGERCQSCGVPIGKTSAERGTHSDGRISEYYCARCYQSGKFTQPMISLDEMKTSSLSRMTHAGMPPVFAKWLVRDLRELRRWKLLKEKVKAQGNL